MISVGYYDYLEYIECYKCENAKHLIHEMVGMTAPKIHCWYDGDVMVAMSKDNRYYVKEQ